MKQTITLADFAFDCGETLPEVASTGDMDTFPVFSTSTSSPPSFEKP